jgi:hypothetical protein
VPSASVMLSVLGMVPVHVTHVTPGGPQLQLPAIWLSPDMDHTGVQELPIASQAVPLSVGMTGIKEPDAAESL